MHKPIISGIAMMALLVGAPSATAQIQWSEPMQLTDSIAFMNVRAALQGDVIHVVGHSDPINFYYVRSTDGGATWSRAATPAPADTFNGCSQPDVICSNGKVHMAWLGNLIGLERDQVYHISSSDSGATWSTPHRVFDNDAGFLKYPRLAAKGDTLFLTCRVADVGYSYNLVFRSFNAGNSWRDSTIAEPASWGADTGIQFLYSNGIVHLIYAMSSGGLDIFYRRSADLGLTWSEAARLSTQDGEAGQGASAAADSLGRVVAGWMDYKYGSMCGFSGDILNRVSLDNGVVFESEGRGTNTQSGNASSFSILDDVVNVIWGDEWPFGCGHPKIMYSYSRDWGQTWAEPQLISGNYPSNDRSTAIVGWISGDTTIIRCFWDRAADFGTDLWYVRGQYIRTSVQDRDETVASYEITLLAYPNPFNSSVAISYSLDSREGGALAIYDLLGQRIKVFELLGKEGKISWDAKDKQGKTVSSGIYFAQVQTPQSSSVIRLYYVK